MENKYYRDPGTVHRDLLCLITERVGERGHCYQWAIHNNSWRIYCLPVSNEIYGFPVIATFY